MQKAVLALAAIVAVPATAHAFCGFYVAGNDQQMFNDATQVVMMRKGTRTVLSMQNNYKGPPEAFAMVIPVPVVLHEGDVKTLPKESFANIERMGAPRLVEYWEQDPCYKPPPVEYDMAPSAGAAMSMEAKADSSGPRVVVEAKFVVGEYQIVILSAKDSTGLDAYLRDEKYNIPKGAEPLLRPYVEAGMKFFVAKVDPQKVKFEPTGSGADRRAALSPLRFHYDTDEFSLPIRLGLANSQGTQDLIVNILAPNQRYEVANYKNVTIPTNLDVRDSVKGKFGAFYTALFDRTIEKNPGAVVTEYAWQATSCDPCPGPPLDPQDFALFGFDVIDKLTPEQQAARKTAQDTMAALNAAYSRGAPQEEIQKLSDDYNQAMRVAPPEGNGYDFVLTRLHARYGKDIKDDLVFKAAEPIVGGREHVIDEATGKLEQGAQKDSMNNFQGRYAIRHEWTGPISCMNPHRGVWGGPPRGAEQASSDPTPALDLAFAPRGQVKLAEAVTRDIPELDVKAKKSGCGCQTTDGANVGLLVIGVGLLLRRRRS
jgi:MYXO-CTERM domain-containing protein